MGDVAGHQPLGTGQEFPSPGTNSLHVQVGSLVTQLRDEVLQMVEPELRAQDEANERMVTRAQILIRDAVEYKNKLSEHCNKNNVVLVDVYLAPSIIRNECVTKLC